MFCRLQKWTSTRVPRKTRDFNKIRNFYLTASPFFARLTIIKLLIHLNARKNQIPSRESAFALWELTFAGNTFARSCFCEFTFKNFKRIYFCICPSFFGVFCLFFFSSYFLCNGINPVLSSVMLHLPFNKKRDEIELHCCSIFCGNLNLETSRKFIFTRTHSSRNYFLQFRLKLLTPDSF